MSENKGAEARATTLDAATAFQHVLACYRAGQFAQAKLLCQEILKPLPDQPEVIGMLGAIACAEGDFAAAVPRFRQVAKLRPADAAAQSNLGFAFRRLGRLGDALACFDKALSIAPDFADALRNRVVTLLDLGHHAEALAGSDRALALTPASAPLLCSRGNALMGLDQPEAALASYEQAVALDPGFVEAVYNQGNALRVLERLAEALAAYDRATTLSRDDVDVAVNRGIVLGKLGRHGEALASFERALALQPESTAAMRNRAIALEQLDRFEEAARQLERLLRRDPRHKYVRGDLLYDTLRCSDWANYRREVAAIETGVLSGAAVATPGVLPALSGSAAAQLKAARAYSQERYPASASPACRSTRQVHDKIRVAYLSADFHHHATAHLMAGLFEAHDRSRFEIGAWSFGPDTQDDYRKRLKAVFDRFIDVRHLSDRAVAEQMVQQEIDIAIDLKAYTESGRLGILACRPAPVQVNYLGHPGTSGAPYIDYILADRTLIPASEQRFYSERIVYLPESYQPNDDKRRIDEQAPARRESGLPESGFVFCCFNAGYKITPPVFDIWMRLLQRCAGSVLWLLEGPPAATRNLRREAASRGVAPERLVFAPRLPLETHLARQRLAGLFLDTLPCNAHTTASDALWAGLPVLTCLGTSFAGRVAASLLRAVGLPDLVAETLTAYEAKAVELATHPAALAGISARLARNRTVFPLFDTARYCRHVESAYRTMYERSRRGDAPIGFEVEPI